MSNQEPPQPQNSAATGVSGVDPNQADEAIENLIGGIENLARLLPPQVPQLRELLLQLPAHTVESLRSLEQILTRNNELREDLELYLFLFYKEKKSVYSFLGRVTRKLVTRNVAMRYNREKPTSYKSAFKKELPTIHEMIIGVDDLCSLIGQLYFEPELENLLSRLPVVSVEGLKLLDFELLSNDKLRNALVKRLIEDGMKIKRPTMYCHIFMKQSVKTLMDIHVAHQYRRVHPGEGQLNFTKELPTIYEILLGAAKEYMIRKGIVDSALTQLGSVLSESCKECRDPTCIQPHQSSPLISLNISIQVFLNKPVP